MENSENKAKSFEDKVKEFSNVYISDITDVVRKLAYYYYMQHTILMVKSKTAEEKFKIAEQYRKIAVGVIREFEKEYGGESASGEFEGASKRFLDNMFFKPSYEVVENLKVPLFVAYLGTLVYVYGVEETPRKTKFISYPSNRVDHYSGLIDLLLEENKSYFPKYLHIPLILDTIGLAYKTSLGLFYIDREYLRIRCYEGIYRGARERFIKKVSNVKSDVEGTMSQGEKGAQEALDHIIGLLNDISRIISKGMDEEIVKHVSKTKLRKRGYKFGETKVKIIPMNIFACINILGKENYYYYAYLRALKEGILKSPEDTKLLGNIEPHPIKTIPHIKFDKKGAEDAKKKIKEGIIAIAESIYGDICRYFGIDAYEMVSKVIESQSKTINREIDKIYENYVLIADFLSEVYGKFAIIPEEADRDTKEALKEIRKEPLLYYGYMLSEARKKGYMPMDKIGEPKIPSDSETFLKQYNAAEKLLFNCKYVSDKDILGGSTLESERQLVNSLAYIYSKYIKKYPDIWSNKLLKGG